MQSVITSLGEKTFATPGIWFGNLVQKILSQCSNCTLVQKCFIKSEARGAISQQGICEVEPKRVSFHSLKDGMRPVGIE